MIHTAFATVGLVLVQAATPIAAHGHNEAYPCFSLHGALADDIGHPSYRITPETPGGLLAIRDGDRQPANLWKLLPSDPRAVETTITGDFVVCPLEAPRPGKLRLVTIKSARNLKVHIGNWMETGR
jgi:hypothetical protein